MSASTIKIEFLPILNGRGMRLLEDVSVTSAGNAIIVPAGFEFDGASTPRFVWLWLPPLGHWTVAALVHDYLCRLHAHGVAHEAAKTRADIDRIFYDLLRQSGVRRLDATVMWAAVRSAANLFGWTKRGYAGSAMASDDLLRWRG